MRISKLVEIRDDVLKGEVLGWIRLRGIFENAREAYPDYIFSITFPSTDILNLLKAVDERLRGVRNQGLFEILGGYGTGKSHILVLLYHLFTNPDKSREWLSRHNIELSIPGNVKVMAFSLMDEPCKYLWEPIFKGLGKDTLLEKVTDEYQYPGTFLLKEALKDFELVVIIIDELGGWYKTLNGKEKDLNLAFLQVLAEVACEEKSNLLVFCALYGEEEDIMARLARVEPYRVNLTLSKDRPRIVLFRLISKVIDEEGVTKVIKSYIDHYSLSGIELPSGPQYESLMRELYPIHPALMDVLLEKYSSSPNYQNTRGVLCLLASVLAKKYQNTDLLLPSDIDMTESDLLELDRELVENAQKDADIVREPYAREVLNTILLHSFGEEKIRGATRDDIILGVLRPGININDIDMLVEELPHKAPHVWLRDGRYVIGRRENIVTLIHVRAANAIKRGEIDDALKIISERLKVDRSYYVYHTDERFRDAIKDDERLKVVVSLKHLTSDEINQFFWGKEWNRVILVVPKEGDITKDEDLLVIAQRLHLCRQYKKEVKGDDKKMVLQLEERDSDYLNERLTEKYGYWIKVLRREADGKIVYKPVPCDLKRVRDIVRGNYDVDVIKEEIVRSITGKESGCVLKDILDDFKRTFGKPIIVVHTDVENAVKSLYDEGKIVIQDGAKVWDGTRRLYGVSDSMKLILKEYYKPPKPVIRRVEKEKTVEGQRPTLMIEERKPGEIVTRAETKRREVIETRLAPPIRIETREHPTFFALATELERRIREGVIAQTITLKLRDLSFDDFNAFMDFLKKFSIRTPAVRELSLDLEIKGPMSKGEILKMLDELPVFRKGKVKAVVEVGDAA